MLSHSVFFFSPLFPPSPAANLRPINYPRQVRWRRLKAGWNANAEDYHHYSVIPHETAGSLRSMAGSLLSVSFMSFWGAAGRIAAIRANRPTCVLTHARAHTHTLSYPLLALAVKPALFVLRLLSLWQPHRIITGLRGFNWSCQNSN